MEFNIHVIPDLTNFALQLLATLVLFLVVRHFLYAPVTNLINKRKEIVAANIAEAEKIKEEAAKMKGDYEADIRAAQHEAKEIVDHSRVRAEKLKQQIMDEAHEEVKQVKIRASKDIERDKEQAQREMKDEIAQIAMLVASKIIQKNLDNQSQQNLIDQFIDEVGGSQWQN